jgi:hypothetical protein
MASVEVVRGDEQKEEEGARNDGGASSSSNTFVAIDLPVEPILTRLEDFFSSPELTCAINDFMTEHSSKVEFVAPDDEQPLQNHDIFRRYSEVVENRLEDFLRRENLEMGEVAEACKRAQGGEGASCVTCVDYLVAATEYHSFMLLAYDFASMSMWDQPEDGDGGSPQYVSLEDYDDVVEVVGPGGAQSEWGG